MAVPRQALVYHDFSLRFGRYTEEDSSFEVWVEGEVPGGAMKPDDATRCIYDPSAFWKNPTAGIGGPVGRLERRTLKEEQMYELGRKLADLALPEGPVRSLFDKSLARLKQGEGLRLRLHIDPVALAELPWEYLCLPQATGDPQPTDFLALQRKISIVRTDTVEAASRELPDREVARIVGVLSGPEDEDDLRLDADKKAIEQVVQALNEAAGQDVLDLRWAERPATVAAVEQALADGADLFAFAGHGIFDPGSQEGQLILENEDSEGAWYSGKKLAQLLGNAGVRLAVLGACETGRRDGKNVWNGMAPALTREKIPAVIASQFKIKDDSAVLLAAKIYHRLLAGFTVDEALYEARQSIYQHKGLEQRDWGVPVLYLHDEDGVLFTLPGEDEPDRAKGSPFLSVSNRFKQVRGEVVDVEIGKVTGGRIEVRDEIDVVEEDASFASVKIDVFGN